MSSIQDSRTDQKEGLSETAAAPGAATLTAIPSESDGACTEGAAVSSKREETADPKEGGHGEDPMTEAATGANGGELPEEEEEDKDDPEAQSPTSTESSSSNITSSISSSSSFSNANNSYKVKRIRPSYPKPLQTPCSLPLMLQSWPTLHSQYFVPNPYSYYQYPHQQHTPPFPATGLLNGAGGGVPACINEVLDDEDPPKSTSNLYIRGLPEQCTDEDLLKMCEKYGTIKSTKSILDKKTGLCKGYGFVDFSEEVDALKALESLQADGVDVQFARRQEEDPTNLYLSNLPKSYSEKDLEKLFSRYGRIISTRVLREPNGYSRGVGFVRLDSRENCEKAREALNNSIFPGTELELNIKFADSSNYKRKVAYWKENEASNAYLPPGSEYVYDLSPTQSLHPTVLQQNGLPTSRILQQAAGLNGNHQPQYIQPVPNGGYQSTSTSSPWHNYYTCISTQQPAAVGSSQQSQQSLISTSVEPVTVRTITSQMGQVQLSNTSPTTAGGLTPTAFTSQPQHPAFIYGGAPSTPTGGSGAGNLSHGPPIIPSHAVRYTQQPPGWTISPNNTQYLPH